MTYVRPFETIIRPKKGRARLFLMLSLVFIISNVFHCFFFFFFPLFFKFQLFRLPLNFKQDPITMFYLNCFDSWQNKHLNFKQDPIINVLSPFRKNDISVCFVHKSRKWAISGLTCKDKRSQRKGWLCNCTPDFQKPIHSTNCFKRCARPEPKKRSASGALWSSLAHCAAGRHPYAYKQYVIKCNKITTNNAYSNNSLKYSHFTSYL